MQIRGPLFLDPEKLLYPKGRLDLFLQTRRAEGPKDRGEARRRGQGGWGCPPAGPGPRGQRPSVLLARLLTMTAAGAQRLAEGTRRRTGH